MSSQTNTLYVVIDPSGAQAGSAASVNAINSIVQSALQLNVTINQTNNNLNNLGNQGQTRRVTGLQSVIRALSTEFGRLSSIVAAAQPVRMFESFIGQITEVDRVYNGFLAMMNVTTGDIKKSGDEFKYVTTMANAYGVQVDHLLKSYAKLRASTADLMTKQETQKLFQSVTAVATVMHAESYTVERMMNAFIQMASKGQVHMEELKQQLGEHLPGALTIAARAMKMKVGEMIDAIGKGQIDARRLLVPLPDELMERFGAAAEVTSKSLTSQINRLKNLWFEMFTTLSTNGISVGLAGIVSAISSQLDPASGSIVEFSNVIGSAMLDVADFIRQLKPDDLKAFAESVIDVTKALITFSGLIVDGIKFVSDYRAEFALLITTLIAYRAYTASMVAINAAAATSTGLLAIAVTALRGAVASLFAFAIGWSIGTYLSQEFEIVEKAGISLASGLTKLPIRIVGAWNALKIQIPLIFGQAFEGALNQMFKFFDYAKSFGTKFIGYLGLNEPKRQAFDFTSGLKAELASIGSETTAQLAEVDKVYQAMFDAVGQKSGDDKSDIMSRLGLSKDAIAEAKAFYESLKSDEEEVKRLMANSGHSKGKSQAEKLTADYHNAVNAAKAFKNVYDVLVQDIKTAASFSEISPTQAFQQQIDQLVVYAEKARNTLKTAIGNPSTNGKERAKLTSELMAMEKDYQIQLKTLQRDMSKEREEYLGKIESLEIDSNARRMSRLDQFVRDWRKTGGDLLERAQLENDNEAVDRIMSAYKALKARAEYLPDPDSDYSPAKASADLVKDNSELFRGTDRTLHAVIGLYEGYYERLNDLREAKSISDDEYRQMYIQAETAMHQQLFSAAVKAAQDRLALGTGSFGDAILSTFGKIAEGFTTLEAGMTEQFGSFFDTFTNGFADSVGRAIVYAEDLNDALMSIAGEAISALISGLIKLGIQWALNAALGNSIQASAGAASAAITATMASSAAAAWAPAAALASLATMGANSGPAMAGLSATTALSSAIAATSSFAGAFDSGGHIPAGSWGIAGERGPEIVQGPANVVSRVDTAKMLQYSNEIPNSSKTGASNDDVVEAIKAIQFSQPDVKLTNLNVFDKELIGEYLKTDEGQRLVMNIVQLNASSLNN